MNISQLALSCIFAIIAVICTVAIAENEVSDKSDEPSSEELMLLAHLLQGNDIDDKESEFKELFKRQAKNGEMMDYGWGGGWFGKRSADALGDYANVKRYDPFNVGGRFGKRYDPFNVGGRFGKRYDPFNVGGRFGKRYDPFNVGGRFGKRYDPFNVGGRFGKRSGDKRYDMYSVGGRFGRDISHLKEGHDSKTQ